MQYNGKDIAAEQENSSSSNYSNKFKKTMTTTVATITIENDNNNNKYDNKIISKFSRHWEVARSTKKKKQ